MIQTTTLFATRTSVEQVELGDELAPRFDADGLLPAIVINTQDQSVLMLGYMNAEALELTLSTKQAHFWSRSRKALWRKGEHSGFTQSVERILMDDDQDALILYVDIEGPGSCHVGFKSCFYREVDLGSVDSTKPAKLVTIESERAFDADAVYAGLPNPTKL
ncbi:MAG: phosphoribosyl-AMP cyclohydrolase [Erythrobacter sp.]|uniref:phosphoribosyl-AMP cyclohydrolase n=1 Tax=Erythrobacter sp. TaxID=1042 RepID=UPI00261DAA8A|nr:phosphoribosyl-AMP cyclohydrolase [Erythrobacter sp.]MDJ0977269.1 phosphoribosyl-AMP cyclohydrolase [Erythrobacter sp.]